MTDLIARTESVSPDKLHVGDLIMFYGNVYRLSGEAKISSHHRLRHDEYGPDRPCYVWPCEWVDALPHAGTLKSWDRFQGNTLARWSRIIP